MPRSPRKFSDAQLLAALTHAHGDVSTASRQLNCSPALIRARLATLPAADYPEIVLWHRLRTHPHHLDIRDRLVERYLPLVDVIVATACRMLPPYIDRPSLTSAGRLGLLGAIRRYDHTRSIKFASFATPRIRGAVHDELRKVSPASRLTLALRAKRIQAISTLSHTLGRQPSPNEVQAKLGWTTEKFAASFAPHIESLAFRAKSPNRWHETNDVPDTSTTITPAAIAANISQATRGLPFDHRIAIYLYYAKGRTLKQIGEAMGLSEARCFQLRVQSLEWLRQHRSKDELVEVLM